MWIRSQNKKTLMEVNKIYTTYDKVTSKHQIKSANIVLATYKTKDRAIEIIGEIQEAIIDNISFGVTSNKKVYELPEV